METLDYQRDVKKKCGERNELLMIQSIPPVTHDGGSVMAWICVAAKEFSTAKKWNASDWPNQSLNPNLL